jgi:hypothetical protein
LSGFGERKSPGDEGPDLLLSKKVQKSDQILTKGFRLPPFEKLNAVGDHSLPPGEKPAAGDVQAEKGGAGIALPMTWTTRSQSLAP